MARFFFFLLCLELGCLDPADGAAQNGKSRPGHASLSSTSRIHVWRGACAAWTLRFLLKNGQRGGKNRHTNLQVQARAALGCRGGGSASYSS